MQNTNPNQSQPPTDPYQSKLTASIFTAATTMFGIRGSTGPKAHRQKVSIWSFLIPFCLGLAFIYSGWLTLRSVAIGHSWVKIQGQVVGVETRSGNKSYTYAPVVGYTVDGRNYEVVSRSSSGSQPVIGSPKQVAYNPLQPQRAKVVESTGTVLLFGYVVPTLGLVLVVVAFKMYSSSLKREKRIHALMQHGRKLQGTVTDVQYKGANNPKCKLVVSVAGASNGSQLYESDYLIGVGAMAVADFKSNKIYLPVYVNPIDSNDYYVDLSELPSLTTQRLIEIVNTTQQQLLDDKH